MVRYLTFVCFAVLISGCASTPRSSVLPTSALPDVRYHTVRSGDTLWSIAKSCDVDIKELMRINSIRNSDVIAKGQVLKIPSASRTVQMFTYGTSTTSFAWPVKGQVVSSFGDKNDRVINKGINIKGIEGECVRASRTGRVVYCDPHLKGFGKTVILDHGDSFQTVYSYNSNILVRVGDFVRQGDTIATVGRTGRADGPTLHFEIRKDGEPQNPAYYLPR